MKNAYILFRSRNDLMNYQKVLNSYGVPSEMVNAPRSMATSCSLAIKTSPQNVQVAQQIAQRHNYSGMNGIYIVDKNAGQRDIINKIY
ncbi:MAG: DUF3343 domain-containing protein [Clostridia bacterium]